MEKKWLKIKWFLPPTSRANTGDSVSIVSVLCSSEKKVKLETTSNIAEPWQGKLISPYLKCLKVLNKKRIFLIYCFCEKFFENFRHIHAHERYLGQIYSCLLPSNIHWSPWSTFFSSKSMSSFLEKSNLTQLLLPTCTWMWYHPLRHGQPLQWALSPNKNDSPSISSHQLWIDLLWGMGPQ